MSPKPHSAEERLVELLAERTALEAQLKEVTAEIIATRETLRVQRLEQQRAEPVPSAVDKSRDRLAQIKAWTESGEPPEAIAHRMSLTVGRARELVRQAKAVAPPPPAPPRFNREEWIESFEGQLSILRPHLTQRLLASISLQEWHKHGRSNADPLECARQWSKT